MLARSSEQDEDADGKLATLPAFVAPLGSAHPPFSSSPINYFFPVLPAEAHHQHHAHGENLRATKMESFSTTMKAIVGSGTIGLSVRSFPSLCV